MSFLRSWPKASFVLPLLKMYLQSLLGSLLISPQRMPLGLCLVWWILSWLPCAIPMNFLVTCKLLIGFQIMEKISLCSPIRCLLYLIYFFPAQLWFAIVLSAGLLSETAGCIGNSLQSVLSLGHYWMKINRDLAQRQAANIVLLPIYMLSATKKQLPVPSCQGLCSSELFHLPS